MRHQAFRFGRWCVAVASLVLAASPGCAAEESPDEAAIRRVVTQVDSANQGCDGEAAAFLFTASSIARYAGVLDAALHARRTDLEKLDDWDLSEALRIRLLASRSRVEGLGPREYVVFATSKGWYQMEDFEPSELGRVSITGDAATATLIVDGEKSPYLVKFAREDGAWRLDEESWRAPFNRLVAEVAGDDRRERAEYVLEMLEEETGKEAPESIWQPMVNPAGAFNPGGG